jgi:hypothetical protein
VENPAALVSFYINKFCVSYGYTVADFSTRYTLGKLQYVDAFAAADLAVAR